MKYAPPMSRAWWALVATAAFVMPVVNALGRFSGIGVWLTVVTVAVQVVIVTYLIYANLTEDRYLQRERDRETK